MTDPERCCAVGCPFRHAGQCKRDPAHVVHSKGPLGAGHFLRSRFGHGQALSLTRIGDPRILHLIQKWLKAGVLENGVVTDSEKGTGQGTVISPLLANVYLHYSLDLWAERWRRREATGDMIIVRYATTARRGGYHVE